MTEQHTVDELERALRGDGAAGAGPDLAAVRRAGTRRRRLRGAGAALAAVAVAAGLSTGVALAGSGGADRGSDDRQVATTPTPTGLSALAARALAEVPGARQVSAWQVVLPGPGRPRQGTDTFPADQVRSEVADLGAHGYTGVTMFGPRAFPAWLRTGVLRLEQEAGDENGYPVGSTDMGILVDTGPLRLACVGPDPDWDQEDDGSCFPAVLGEHDGGLTYEWGMGTDDFLAPGSEMELFSTSDYSTGSPRTVWIGGRDGTDTARVELVTTDGDRVDAEVASGSLVPEETMFWAAVEGELARATAYDADGVVLEDHELEPCSGGADCEVR